MRSFGPRFATTPRLWSLALLALLVTAGLAPSAHAGCGCTKPPPSVAPVRPSVTYSGMPVTFFSPSFQAGQTYTVTFTAMTGATGTASGVVVAKRDQADAVVKPRLRVTLPPLPLGPAAITVKLNGAAVNTLTIADSSFTVAPPPLALPTVYGNYTYPNQKAAVGRDGTVYFSLDLNGLQAPLIFDATLTGYPLRFSAQDVVFKNTQGFLMQKLVTGAKNGVAPIPGMAVFPASAPTTTSDTIHYSRHEFSTYFLQHQERLPHATDPTDPEWHADGSRHIDHDHLIVAVTGKRNDGTLPPAGATPAFTLSVKAFSLFYQGLVGDTGISMSNSATTDSFNPTTGQIGQRGDVFTNATLKMTGTSRVEGDATAGIFDVGSSSVVTGTRTVRTTPMTFMPIIVPTGIPQLADISLSGGTSATIVGPGSFRINKISVSHADSRLYIDNSAGPVTLYVTSSFKMSAGAVVTSDPNPEKFAMYVTGTNSVALKGGTTTFYGVVYAPNGSIDLSGSGQLTGAFVGKSLTMSGTTRARYDSRLRGQ